MPTGPKHWVNEHLHYIYIYIYRYYIHIRTRRWVRRWLEMRNLVQLNNWQFLAFCFPKRIAARLGFLKSRGAIFSTPPHPHPVRDVRHLQRSTTYMRKCKWTSSSVASQCITSVRHAYLNVISPPHPISPSHPTPPHPIFYRWRTHRAAGIYIYIHTHTHTSYFNVKSRYLVVLSPYTSDENREYQTSKILGDQQTMCISPTNIWCQHQRIFVLWKVANQLGGSTRKSFPSMQSS